MSSKKWIYFWLTVFLMCCGCFAKIPVYWSGVGGWGLGMGDG